MSANRAAFPIARMARVLGVSKAGYHAWAKRPPSAHAQADAALLQRIRTVHASSRQTYGAPRVHAELRAQGERHGRKRIARLMREAGLVGASHRRGGPVTTRRDEDHRPAPDLVDRNFTAERPDQLWVADITFIPSATGFLHLAVVLDAWSRKIVGWSMANHLRTELVLGALEMAVGQRRPKDVIHHSDQGSQGGSNRSSQHSGTGGCDDEEETAIGHVRARQAVLAGTPGRGAARDAGGVLGCGGGWQLERGRGGVGRCIGAGGNKVVPEVRRHATNSSVGLGAAAVGALSVVCGAGGDRAVASSGPRHARHRPAPRPSAVDNLAGAAAQRGDARRWPGVPGDNGAMACGPLGSATKGFEACNER